MSGDQQNKASEATVEEPLEHEELDLSDLESGGRTIGERDNQDQPEMCKLLDPEIPLDKQTERVALLRGAMIDIVAKLMKEGVPVEVLAKKPEMLCQLVAAKELPLEPDEQVALSNLNFLLGQNGTVPAYFRDSALWEGIISEAGSLFKAPKDFFSKIYEEHPTLTKAAGISLILGLGVLGYKLFMSEDEKKAQEKEEMSAFAKVAIALGGVAAVGYFAGDSIKDFLKDWAKGNTLKSFDEKESLAALKKELPSDEKAYPESLEKRPRSNTLFIGDSIASGLANVAKINRNFDFIGKSGKTSSEVLSDVKENKDKLSGKEVVVINVGGNDITKTNRTPEQIAENIKEIIKECRLRGVKRDAKFVLLTRFPYDERLQVKWGAEYAGRKRRSKMLRDHLIEMKKGGQLEGVELVDLYGALANERGELKREYAHKKAILHPYDAYGAALKLIEEQVGERNFVRRLNAQPAVA